MSLPEGEFEFGTVKVDLLVIEVLYTGYRCIVPGKTAP